jgi:signal transduction histidine kinase
VFGLAGALTILFAIAGGMVLSQRALDPLRRLIRTTRMIIDTGIISSRIPDTDREDELGMLVSLFNGMLSRIEKSVEGMRGALDEVAHDVRTPLTRIRTGAEVALRQTDDPERWRRALEDTVDQTDDLLRLSRMLLDITLAEAGSLRLDRSRVDLAPLLADVAELYGYVAEEQEVSLSLAVPDQLVCYADPGRIRQVLSNLLDNAIKYTDSGGTIDVTATATDTSVRIDVRDTGAGIPESDQAHVWDRLFRGRDTKAVGGLGLGLSVVKAVVEAHGGSVGLQSQAGAGSTFTVTLPVSR